MAPVFAVVAAVSTVASISAQKKAAKARERQETVATRRSQRQTIREAQLRRAQALASAEGFGALEGSGIAGGVSSLSSQLGGTLGFSTEMSGLSRKINKYESRANTFSGLAGLSWNLYNFSQKAAGGGSGGTPKGVV